MRLTADRESGVLHVSAQAVAEFARRKNGDASRLGFIPVVDDGEETDVRVSVPGFAEAEAGTFTCRIEGVADAVFSRTGGIVVEKQRRIRRSPSAVGVLDDPVFTAHAIINAYLVCCAEGWEDVTVRLVFIREKSGERAVYESRFARAVLSMMFEALFSRARPFIEIEGQRQTDGRKKLASLRFPYRSVREGQRDFIEETYRCIRTGRRLLVSAPTGIGKTMSGTYPALRAIGASLADRVFYFTAKTVTGNAALDAVRTLGKQAEGLRCIRLAAKERACPVRRQDREIVTNCRLCANRNSFEGVSYEERRDAALLKLLTEGRVYDSADIEKTAQIYRLCPYELSLDLSEYCEMIVCDYGYLFDSHVSLRRYFSEDEGRGEKYVFLIDEAHNLPDRAREMYSASLSRQAFEKFASDAEAAMPDDRALKDADDCMRAMFDGLDALCMQNAEMDDTDGRVSGCVLEKTAPPFLADAVARLSAVCDAYIRKDYDNAMPLFGGMRTSLREMSDALSWADEHFAFYAEAADGETSCRLMCLDPSAMLDTALSKGVSAVLFSATLSPMEYYADVCGMSDAVRLELPSPYEAENLCLVTVDSVSTRFSTRKQSAADIAELIAAITESHAGNYIVYFPSYAYMAAVCRQYLRLVPDGHTVAQKQGMSLGERERFLRAFAKAQQKGVSLVAFCVLGGVFSEGIDLQGEKLIGSIIVGLGLPGLSSELNILTEYYDRTRENGKEYAYTYPAINKILQAAGRVIRSEEDRGVVVLIDDRYLDPGIRSLFPPHWSRMQYTGDAYSLSAILERFWKKWE